MRADINVTPLVDIMLVLLIIFMVVTPTATRSIDTQLPRPPSESTAPPAPLVVTVEPEAFRIDDTPVPTASDLESRLRDRLATRADRTVFVRAEGAVTYGRVVEAMDSARGAGAERIGVLGTKR